MRRTALTAAATLLTLLTGCVQQPVQQKEATWRDSMEDIPVYFEDAQRVLHNNQHCPILAKHDYMVRAVYVDHQVDSAYTKYTCAMCMGSEEMDAIKDRQERVSSSMSGY